MSDKILLSEEFTLVIDTNVPAYAFADRLVAYCTGYTDEYGPSEAAECVEMFYRDFNLKDDQHVQGKLSKGKCRELKNPFSDAINLKELDSMMTPWGIMLNSNYGADDHGNFAKLTEDNFDNFSYPAPLSVGIFFAVKPDKSLIEIIKARAVKFFEEIDTSYNGVPIEGYRLICYERFAKEEKI